MINYISIKEIWLILGIFCIGIEISALPSIGFLFLGLGALTNGIILHIFPNFEIYHYAIFGFASFIWTLILWWPLKIYSSPKNNKSPNFSDMIGAHVEVFGQELIPGAIGQIKWSGTIMNAQLNDDITEVILPGELLRVKEVKGNILICIKN